MAGSARQQNKKLSLGNELKGRSKLSSSGMTMVAIVAVLTLWTMASVTMVTLDSMEHAEKDAVILLRHKANTKVGGLKDDLYGALAMDVQKSLQCDSLGKPLHDRRMQVEVDGIDDDFLEHEGEQGAQDSATHLMCLAAGTPTLSTGHSFHCDPMLPNMRMALLDLWSSVRSQVPLHIIKQSFDISFESHAILVDKPVRLWHPNYDTGLELAQQKVNGPHNIQQLASLPLSSNNSNNNKQQQSLFVDIGAHQGLLSLAIKILHPHTTIITIEPAAPNFIMQNLNFICNLPLNDPHKPPSLQPQPKSILAGVAHKDNTVAKLNWQPSNTGATRSWTPSAQHHLDDIELTVRLRTLRSIMAEAMPEDLPLTTTPITVLKLSCEGCEYNIVPNWSDSYFQSISVIMGDLHWEYIPIHKKPSSQRAYKTNVRLCQHEFFARSAIECCAFLDLPVKFNQSLHIQQQQQEQQQLRQQQNGQSPIQQVTVKDYIPKHKCDNFDTWTKQHHLNDIEDDYGWFELTSFASD